MSTAPRLKCLGDTDTPRYGAAGMAERVASRQGSRTRTRILGACQQLFNERGPADVTTAEIAEVVGINEGNLYYHFQRKEQIIEALFEEFEDSLHKVASAYLAYGDDPRRYAEYLAGWFNLMWEWRFLYRDGASIHRLCPSLRVRVKALSDTGHDQVRHALKGMEAADLIRATPEEIERLIVNAWIIATYWIDYLRSRRGIARITREHIDWGASQVMGLFVPYLTPAGLTLFDMRSAKAP